MPTNEWIRKHRAVLKAGNRVFSCGCTQKTADDVKFVYTQTHSKLSPVCAYHGGHMIGLEITCIMCGKKVIKPPQAARAKYCKDCFDRKYKRGKYRKKRPEPAIPLDNYEREYIVSHPWRSAATLGDELGRDHRTIRKYQRAKGIKPKQSGLLGEYKLREWFEAHKHLAYGG